MKKNLEQFNKNFKIIFKVEIIFTVLFYHSVVEFPFHSNPMI